MSEYREWQEIGRVSHLDSIRSISIYNSNYLISAGDDCLIRIWDITRLETNKQIHNIMSLREHNAPVFTSILLNDILYTAGLEGVIKAWDIAGLIADTDTDG
jgi:WD40 repeat protein